MRSKSRALCVVVEGHHRDVMIWAADSKPPCSIRLQNVISAKQFNACSFAMPLTITSVDVIEYALVETIVTQTGVVGCYA